MSECPKAIHHLEEVMGTVVTLDIYPKADGCDADLSAYLARAEAILQLADDVFSTWKPSSPVSRLRRNEITLEQAPPEVAEVFELCGIARQISGGWFDPWAMPGGFDPTGYVKGWAAQCALEALISSDVSGAIVNAAGDIASFGAMENNQPFRIGIVDPFEKSQLACVVELSAAVATSGTYERGNHLIDPHSSLPTARVASATVVGDDLGLADALATAVAVGGAEVLPLIEHLDGYEAFIIGLDTSRLWTAQFPFASTRDREKVRDDGSNAER